MEDHSHLLDKVGGLRSEVEQRNRRVRELEEELEQSRKRREDAAKKIDALIGRLDEIESEVMAEPLPAAAVQGK